AGRAHPRGFPRRTGIRFGLHASPGSPAVLAPRLVRQLQARLRAAAAAGTVARAAVAGRGQGAGLPRAPQARRSDHRDRLEVVSALAAGSVAAALSGMMRPARFAKAGRPRPPGTLPDDRMRPR